MMNLTMSFAELWNGFVGKQFVEDKGAMSRVCNYCGSKGGWNAEGNANSEECPHRVSVGCEESHKLDNLGRRNPIE